MAHTLTCLSVLVMLAAPASATASEERARTELSAQLADLARAGYAEVVLEDAGRLAPGASMAQRVYLRAGRMYGLVVGGCADALDLDVTVHGPRGELVAGDNDEGRRATLVLIPERSGMYTLTVTMWRSSAHGAHYAMAMAHGS